MYEEEYKPDIYEMDFDLTIGHRDPARPGSYYGVSKLFGEDLGRMYVEKEGSLSSFYALRIASIRGEGDDHPYSDAERKVENGEIERGSEEYHQQVARHKALWFSHRDLVQLVERMLLDETVDFDIFFGVSGNDRRWVDIEHARTVLGYDPQDNGEDWSSPP